MATHFSLKRESVGWAVVACLASFLLLSRVDGGMKRFAFDRENFNDLVALRNVLPVFDNDPTEDVVTWIDSWGGRLKFFPARRKGTCVAVGFPLRIDGRRGSVEALVGLDLNGQVKRVFLLDEEEVKQFAAPGMSQAWLDQFQELQPFQIRLSAHGGKIQAMPKLFYTSERFARAVREGAQFFIDHKNEILQVP